MEQIERLKRTAPHLPFDTVIAVLKDEVKGAGWMIYPKRITKRVIEQLTEEEPTNAAQKCFQTFIHLIGAGILTQHWEFFDREEDEVYSLTPEEVNEATEEGVFYHPQTGREFSDFEDLLMVHYRPADIPFWRDHFNQILMNSKIVLDRRADIDGKPVVMIYGIVVGNDFGITDGKRRIVGANTRIEQVADKRFVESKNLGSPEDILEHHLNFEHWAKDD